MHLEILDHYRRNPDGWGNRKVFRIEPTSCSCGGQWAILLRRSSGAQQMIGCVCHTTVEQLLQAKEE